MLPLLALAFALAMDLAVSMVGARAARTATASKLAEIAGGVILILLGLRILIAHLLD